LQKKKIKFLICDKLKKKKKKNKKKNNKKKNKKKNKILTEKK